MNNHHRTMRCAREGEPACPATFLDSGRWSRTKAHDQGWFFPRDEDKAFCPDHNPPWVARWRAGRADA
jgi:hypothetical protein